MAESWPEPGACFEHPTPQLWDVASRGEPFQERKMRQKIALAYCEECPALARCKASIDPRYDEGVKGGEILPPLKNHPSIGREVGVVVSWPGERWAA